ncbi:hypothetical protein GCM10023325_21850 [Sphingomonas lutea]
MLTKAERWADIVDCDREVVTGLLRRACFVTDEAAFRADGALAPDDNHHLGRVEMAFDLLPPVGAAADMLVPPDVEAFRLERFDQGDQPLAVLRLVGDEDVIRRVGHGARPPWRCVGAPYPP